MTLGLAGALGCGDDGGAAGTGGATGSGGAGATTTSSSSGGSTTVSGTGGGGGGRPTALVHRVGRFDDTDPAHPGFTWPGTSFRTRVDGGDLSIALDGPAGVFFQVVVDGAPTTVFETASGPATYPLATGLTGEHDVEVHRRNEGFFGVVTFDGFTTSAGGTQVPSPSPYVHTMEFIGDSITCGYGVEGPDANCNFSGDTESAYETYAAIAARNVGAAAHLIAYSGKGVHQNYGGGTTELMPELWLRTLTEDANEPWDFSQFVPEVVVINLGTNDFSVAIDGDAFIADYVDLLSEVRTRYPAADIFAIRWKHWGATNEGYVMSAVSQHGDAKVHDLELSIDAADGFGCDYHPSLITHQKLGALLTQTLNTTLGW
jgi:lysophospholipase L1-like esterase